MKSIQCLEKDLNSLPIMIGLVEKIDENVVNDAIKSGFSKVLESPLSVWTI